MNAGVDVGGTFTDLAALDERDGRLLVAKALNRSGDARGGVADAFAAAGISGVDVHELTHGTTVVTNLLVECRGAKVGLICTRGFRDLLEIQLSYREHTFDLRYAKTPPLVPRRLRLEVGGRIDASGVEREPVDAREVEDVVAALRGHGVEAVVVALYNAYANPVHEREVGEIVQRVAPELLVTLSTEVDRRIGEYERVSTAVLNATAVPTMRRYVDELGGVVERPIRYMHSAGGVVPGREAATRPVQLAFSGPAAGVLAGREVARQLGYADAITMDMGGTSCDVCLVWGGELRHRETFDVAWGVPARVRSLDIHSIGAGGGSIAWRDSGDALRVGPRSAGASPGPVCYRRGGTEPTVTDANLVLGILPPGLLGGELPLDRDAAEAVLAALGDEFGVSAEDTAAAVWSTVNAGMAQAIREITVRQGIDPRACLLVAFGGAGPQHAAGVAAELGIRRFAVPANAGVLSALGLLTAEIEASSARTVLTPLESLPELAPVFDALVADAAERLDVDEGFIVQRFGGLRYVGQSHEVPVPLEGDPDEVAVRFAEQHERLYGTRLPDPVEIVDVWATVTRRRRGKLRPVAASPVAAAPAPERELVLAGGAAVQVHRRGASDEPCPGPCLIEEPNCVTYVPAGARMRTQASHLVVELA